MIDNRCDPSSKSRLFAIVGTGVGMSGFYLAGQLMGLVLVHDENRFEPFGKPCVPLDGVGIGSSLQ